MRVGASCERTASESAYSSVRFTSAGSWNAVSAVEEAVVFLRLRPRRRQLGDVSIVERGVAVGGGHLQHLPHQRRRDRRGIGEILLGQLSRTPRHTPGRPCRP